MKIIPIIMLTSLAIACATTSNTGDDKVKQNQAIQEKIEKDAKIRSAFNNATIVFRFDDIPNTYWKTPVKNQSMYYNIFINDTTKTLNSSVVKEFRIYDINGRNWTMEPEYDGARIGEWGNFYSTDLSIDGSVLSLDEYKIELVTKNEDTYTRFIKPSSLLNMETKKYIFSNYYKGKKNDEYVNSLARPNILFAQINNDKIELKFTMTDSRVKNATVNFYNKTNDNIAWMNKIYNSFSEQIHPTLNNGEHFYTDGQVNRMIIERPDIHFTDKMDLKDITMVRIYVYSDENPDTYYTIKDKAFLATNSVEFEVSQLIKN